LNEQIQTEFNAAHTYLSLSNYFLQDTVALKGFGQMMRKSWKEELSHGEKMMDYVLLRGGNLATQNIEVFIFI
jgi:ferritin